MFEPFRKLLEMATEKKEHQARPLSDYLNFCNRDTPRPAQPASGNFLLTGSNQPPTQSSNPQFGFDVADSAAQTSIPMKFHSFGERMATFRTWPRAMAINAVEMAHAGFVYTGISDRVHCPWCNIIVHEFEATDSPYEEHLKHSGGCKYLRMTLPANTTGLCKSLRSRG